jgi:hypothetical protein
MTARESYVVVPAAGDHRTLGPGYAFTSRFDPHFDVAARTRLVVLLDDSEAAQRLLETAISLALPSRAVVTLVGIQGRTAAGDGRTEVLQRVLLPAQARIEQQGLLCERRAVQQAEALVDVQAVLNLAGGGVRLVLGDPYRLAGPLRDLSAELLRERPCPIYLLALGEGPLAGLRQRVRGWLERPATHRPHWRHGEIAR